MFPLRLGWIPVVCRSYSNQNSGVTIEQSLENEKSFFANHDDYSLCKNKTGITYLCNKLNEQIVKHVKMALPIIRSKITSLLYMKEKELKSIHISSSSDNMQ